MSELILVANAGDGTISTLRLHREPRPRLEVLATSGDLPDCGTFAIDADRDLVYAAYKGDPPGICTLGLDRGSGALSEVSRTAVSDSLTYLFLATNWQTAWVTAGVITLVLGLPLLWGIVRSDPADMGLHPDGESNEAVAERAATGAGVMPIGPLEAERWQDSYRSAPIWQLSLAYWVCGITTASIAVHFVRWAGDEGRSWADQITADSAGHARLAPPMSLTELAALARRARFYLGSDSGPLHLAAAVGTPCVGLYGPWPAERHGPYGPGHAVVQKMVCRGPTRRRRNASSRFMDAIDVDSVCDACDGILRRDTSHAA